MTAPGLRPLVRVFAQRGFALADWGARATDDTVGWRRRDDDGSRAGHQQVERYRAIVHRDVPAGRGSATIDIDGSPGVPLAELVGDAAERALATIGPAWTSPPPAAPARVAIADPAIGDVDDVAARIERAIAGAAAAAGAALRAAEVEVVRRTVTLATRGGLDASWPETELVVRADVERGGRRITVRRRARRLDDLDLDAAIDAAVAIDARVAAAAPTPTGRIAIAIEAAALLHGGLGLLAAFVGQADPALERQGLLAARLGQPIVAGAATAAEPLTLVSDGTLAYGLASTPVADLGDPVRRFALIEHGLMRGLALDAREAALRRAQANGGVRGLTVPAGGAAADALVAGAGLLIEALHWLELEPMTGGFRARIALGRLVDGSGGARDVQGGLIRGDALAALALSRRSRELVRTPSYHGPRRWTLGELDVASR